MGSNFGRESIPKCNESSWPLGFHSYVMAMNSCHDGVCANVSDILFETDFGRHDSGTGRYQFFILSVLVVFKHVIADTLETFRVVLACSNEKADVFVASNYPVFVCLSFVQTRRSSRDCGTYITLLQ